MVSNSDEAMKKIAAVYMEKYCQELTEEMERLNVVQGLSASEIRLERRIRGWIAGKKRRPYYIGGLSAIAACFVLAFLYLLPNMLSFDSTDSLSQLPTGAPDTIASPAYPTASLPLAPPSSDVDAWPPVVEAIPLSATLPQGFTQIGFEQDQGKSIYYIEDIFLDNVVIILERVDEPPDTSGLAEIKFGSQTAFGTQTDSYSLLTFTIDDILHILTSKHDINTLIRLGEAFL